MLYSSATSLVPAFLATIQAASGFSLKPSGQTLELDGIPYYVPPKVVTTISSFGSGRHILQAATDAGGLLPITVVSANSTSYTSSDFSKTVSAYLVEDDVYSAGFLEAVYVQYHAAAHVNGHLNLIPSGLNITGPVATTYINNKTAIPGGPYFVSSIGAVYEAWRLYSDIQGAFFETTIGNGDGSYSVLPANVVGQHLAVAVPSRVYFTPTADQPLAGVRLGVKDIFDLKGMRTSNGNRAWYHFYPPANKTALSVQRLIDAGAIVVGKMVTSQFANGETATADWVDYHAPFNPRGDGYQDASSSSAGPGAGIGAYDWLDVALGSDTGGSIRGPSGSQGLYGNRPSIDLVSLEGVMPMSPESDTAGFLTRHPSLWQTVSEVMYEENITISHVYPSTIRTIEFPTSAESDGDALILNFLGNLTSFLSANTSDWNVTTEWAASRPSGAPSTHVELLNLTYPILISKHQAINIRDPFFAAYGAVHDGRIPFIDPAPTIRWNFSDAYPVSAIDEAATNNSIFAGWLYDTVLIPDAETCSSSLMLYINTEADTVYRDVYRKAPGVPFGYGSSRISVSSGCPDFVLPLGVAKYFSNITHHEEYLPVTVDIMAAKGCDGMLFGLVQDLVTAGILSTPEAGYSGTTGGAILYKRDGNFA